jgi:hypothetical protein
MKDALARLRAADPAARAPDPRSPEARALLDRVMSSSVPPRRRTKRLVVGISVATVAAAVAAFFVVDPAAAYTVDRNADGSLAVTFKADRLGDPAKLNASLARAGARTTVMRMTTACTTPLDLDPAFPFGSPDVDRYPVSYRLGDDSVLITIRPEKIPAGESLAFGFLHHDHDTVVRPAVVRSMPPCMARPDRLR